MDPGLPARSRHDDRFNPELVEALPALAAGVVLVLPGSVDTGHSYGIDLPYSGRGGCRNGAGLGAYSGRIRRVFHVDARVELSVGANGDGTNAEVGIRRLGVFGDGSGCGEKIVRCVFHASSRRASTNGPGSKGMRSSIPSPTPMNLTGTPSSRSTAMATPPRAVPSSLVKTMPVTPTASVN